MRNTSFLSHAAVYALGEFLVMSAGLILLPLYTRRLDHEAFGTLELLERFADVLAIGLFTRGVPFAVLVFYKQARDDDERREVVSAGWLLSLGGAALGGALVLPFAAPLGAALALKDSALLCVAVLANFLDSATTVGMAVRQARMESLRYVGLALAHLLLKVALSIYFVVGLGWGVWGIAVASLLRAATLVLFLAIGDLRRSARLPSAALLRRMVSFILPFVPMGLCGFLLNSGDRFFLLPHGGREAVGLYGLGYRLALLVGIFSLTPLYRVWSVRLHDAARSDDAPDVFGRVTTRLLAAYTFVGLGLCLFADEAVRVLGGEGYAAAAEVVPPTVLAYWFTGAAMLADAPFHVRRRGGPKLAVTLTSTAAMLGLYALLIPAHGCLGAALATLAGFVFHAALTWTVAGRLFPIRYEFGRLAALLVSAAAVWAIGRLLPFAAWAVPVKALLWAAWPALLWAGNLVSAEEKYLARETAQQALAAVRRAASLARPAPTVPKGP